MPTQKEPITIAELGKIMSDDASVRVEVAFTGVEEAVMVVDQNDLFKLRQQTKKITLKDVLNVVNKLSVREVVAFHQVITKILTLKLPKSYTFKIKHDGIATIEKNIEDGGENYLKNDIRNVFDLITRRTIAQKAGVSISEIDDVFVNTWMQEIKTKTAKKRSENDGKTSLFDTDPAEWRERTIQRARQSLQMIQEL